jgi:hypothetical protein
MPEKIRSFYALFPVNSLIPFMEKTVQQNFPLFLYLATFNDSTEYYGHTCSFFIVKFEFGNLFQRIVCL